MALYRRRRYVASWVLPECQPDVFLFELFTRNPMVELNVAFRLDVV